MKEQQNWMPLQMNPEVINQFAGKLGLQINQYFYEDLLSIDEDSQALIQGTPLALILIYDESEKQVQFQKQENQHLDPNQIPEDLFYMKQYAHNACGTIAIFHSILNLFQETENLIATDSILHQFKLKCSGKNWEQRGHLFEKDQQIKYLHGKAIQKGQSVCNQEVNEHFICFVSKNNKIYELDGCKKCPVDHGPCIKQKILQKGCEIIRGFMERDPENLNFSVSILVKKG